MSRVTRLLVFAVCAVLASVVFVAVRSGSRAQGSSPWWCSPSGHAAHGGGVGGSLLAAFAAHWPHFLPILLGLATLVYLWRANARYSPPSVLRQQL
jgi:hypothetical protein